MLHGNRQWITSVEAYKEYSRDGRPVRQTYTDWAKQGLVKAKANPRRRNSLLLNRKDIELTLGIS